MMKIGLTGGIGSGKSTVADLFAACGAPVVDTDLIAHQITAPHGAAMTQIAAQFGAQYVAADGSLDRARMRALVFSDDTARARLEAITHPLIHDETTRAIEAIEAGANLATLDAVHGAAHDVARNSPIHIAAAHGATHDTVHVAPAYIILVVPLLVESGTWKARVARVLGVDCAIETQIARVMRRNGFTREQVQAIIARQASRAARLAAADDVIVNDGVSLDALARAVDTLHEKYLALAQTA